MIIQSDFHIFQGGLYTNMAFINLWYPMVIDHFAMAMAREIDEL
jgi:hypothetical protein